MPGNALSLHSLPERNKLEGRRKRFWKSLKKVPKSFGDSEKSLTFAPASNEKHDSKQRQKVLKNSEKKSSKKIWRFEKVYLTLHRDSAENQGGRNWGEDRWSGPNRKKNVLIEIYRTAFFEVFEQLKFYPLSQESDFKQYLWDWS